jgi:hypothetical protein
MLQIYILHMVMHPAKSLRAKISTTPVFFG